ncbi:protein of unknown function [Streptococcus thermophilus]|nr:protein of unknown function [Streptococcus thermophilus]
MVVTYTRSQTNPASTVYAYYDMDGNGVDELVFAFKPGNVFKDYMITDIYTISKDDGQVIRLTDGLQLGMLGERMTLAYLKDKTFSYYGSVGPRQAVVQVTTLIMTASLLSKTTVIQVLKKQIFLVGIGRI